jgi:hypothetical protein
VQSTLRPDNTLAKKRRAKKKGGEEKGSETYFNTI